MIDWKNPISAVHYEVEQEIDRTISDWTIVRPTAFASNALLYWASQVRNGDTVHWPYGAARLSFIHQRDIAAVIALAILTGPLNSIQEINACSNRDLKPITGWQ